LLRNRAARRVALYVPAALVAAGLLWAGWLRRERPDVDTIVSCADAEMRLGLFESAHAQAAEALAKEPHNLHAILIEAHCLNRLGMSNESRDRYRQSLALVDDADLGAEIRLTLAAKALEERHPREALDLLALAHPAAKEISAKVDAVADLARRADVGSSEPGLKSGEGERR